jgi:hypothetical protein
MYRVGQIEVEEQPVPVLKENGTALVRRFSLDAKGVTAQQGVYCELGAGAKIEPGAAAGEWRVDDKLTVRVKTPADSKPMLRETNGTKQLLLRVPFDAQGKAAIEVETSW